MDSNVPLSTSLLLSETHIGRTVEISERIRWAKIPGQDKIIWWPCILYKSFMELMGDLDERLVMFRNNCLMQHRKTQSNEPAVAYFLGFYPPLVRTFKNYSCFPAPQKGEDAFRLDKEGMNIELKNFFTFYCEMQDRANYSQASQKLIRMFNTSVAFVDKILAAELDSQQILGLNVNGGIAELEDNRQKNIGLEEIGVTKISGGYCLLQDEASGNLKTKNISLVESVKGEENGDDFVRSINVCLKDEASCQEGLKEIDNDGLQVDEKQQTKDCSHFSEKASATKNKTKQLMTTNEKMRVFKTSSSKLTYPKVSPLKKIFDVQFPDLINGLTSRLASSDNVTMVGDIRDALPYIAHMKRNRKRKVVSGEFEKEESGRNTQVISSCSRITETSYEAKCIEEENNEWKLLLEESCDIQSLSSGKRANILLPKGQDMSEASNDDSSQQVKSAETDLDLELNLRKGHGLNIKSGEKQGEESLAKRKRMGESTIDDSGMTVASNIEITGINLNQKPGMEAALRLATKMDLPKGWTAFEGKNHQWSFLDPTGSEFKTKKKVFQHLHNLKQVGESLAKRKRMGGSPIDNSGMTVASNIKITGINLNPEPGMETALRLATKMGLPKGWMAFNGKHYSWSFLDPTGSQEFNSKNAAYGHLGLPLPPTSSRDEVRLMMASIASDIASDIAKSKVKTKKKHKSKIDTEPKGFKVTEEAFKLATEMGLPKGWTVVARPNLKYTFRDPTESHIFYSKNKVYEHLDLPLPTPFCNKRVTLASSASCSSTDQLQNTESELQIKTSSFASDDGLHSDLLSTSVEAGHVVGNKGVSQLSVSAETELQNTENEAKTGISSFSSGNGLMHHVLPNTPMKAAAHVPYNNEGVSHLFESAETEQLQNAESNAKIWTTSFASDDVLFMTPDLLSTPVNAHVHDKEVSHLSRAAETEQLQNVENNAKITTISSASDGGLMRQALLSTPMKDTHVPGIEGISHLFESSETEHLQDTENEGKTRTTSFASDDDLSITTNLMNTAVKVTHVLGGKAVSHLSESIETGHLQNTENKVKTGSTTSLASKDPLFRTPVKEDHVLGDKSISLVSTYTETEQLQNAENETKIGTVPVSTDDGLFMTPDLLGTPVKVAHVLDNKEVSHMSKSSEAEYLTNDVLLMTPDLLGTPAKVVQILGNKVSHMSESIETEHFQKFKTRTTSFASFMIPDLTVKKNVFDSNLSDSQTDHVKLQIAAATNKDIRVQCKGDVPTDDTNYLKHVGGEGREIKYSTVIKKQRIKEPTSEAATSISIITRDKADICSQVKKRKPLGRPSAMKRKQGKKIERSWMRTLF